MQVEHQAAVCEVFTQVLERLAYMFAEPVEKEQLLQAPENGVLVNIRFTGELQGMIYLAASRLMCAEMAANVLGLDPADESAQQVATDAIKEVVNVVCGHVLTAIAGERPVFDIGVPMVSTLDPGRWDALSRSPECLGFKVEDQPVLLHFMAQV